MSDQMNKNCVGTIILKCADCGGHLEADKENNTASCPYCGASSLLIESDEVVIERIRSKTFKEVELTKLKLQHQQQIEKKLNKTRKSPFTLIIAILTIASLFMVINIYQDNRLISALFMGCQTLLFFMAWLMRMRIIKGAGIHLHSLFTLLGILLIIPAVMFTDVIRRSYDTYVWQNNNLSLMLPKPQSDYGKIKRDTAEAFNMMIAKVKEEDYNAYVEECIEKGFSLRIYRTDLGYHAYNESGAKLKIIYFSHLREMEISVAAYKDFYEFIWPGRGVAALLPEPVSKLGIINSETEDSFSITVAKTPITGFHKYIDACMEAGFTEDMLKTEYNFYASNSDGIRLDIEYIVNDVMEILVYTP